MLGSELHFTRRMPLEDVFGPNGQAQITAGGCVGGLSVVHAAAQHVVDSQNPCGEHRIVALGATIAILGVDEPHRANQLLPIAHKETFLIGPGTAAWPSNEESAKNEDSAREVNSPHPRDSINKTVSNLLQTPTKYAFTNALDRPIVDGVPPETTRCRSIGVNRNVAVNLCCMV